MSSKLSSLKKGTRALRSGFKYPSHINWYPGHMDKAIKQLKQHFLPNTNIIMEIRDARIPISSQHPHFDELINNKPKLVIFNKADLLNPKHKSKLKNWIATKNENKTNPNEHFIMTSDVRDDTKVANGHTIIKKLHEITAQILKNNTKLSSAPIHNLIKSNDSSMIGVMGYPNVGKSTIINLLRKCYWKRDSAVVGKMAGVTRHISYFKISSDMYLLDTPGIFLPGDNENTDIDSLMKLSICGCIADHIVGHEYVADYILYRLNLHKNYSYLKYCNKNFVHKSCDNIDTVLNAIAHHKHYCNPKKYLIKTFDPERKKEVETYDEYLTPLYLINLYRNGKLDHCVLDEI
eukprot:475963_1